MLQEQTEREVSVLFFLPCWKPTVFDAGLFTSPHLVKINERFQINEVMISDQRFTEAFTEVKNLADRLVEEGDYHPTYFEFLFLMGMIVFKQEDVDYIVLETGLGDTRCAINIFFIAFHQSGPCGISGRHH